MHSKDYFVKTNHFETTDSYGNHLAMLVEYGALTHRLSLVGS